MKSYDIFKLFLHGYAFPFPCQIICQELLIKCKIFLENIEHQDVMIIEFGHAILVDGVFELKH